jgi:hypothetical protein
LHYFAATRGSLPLLLYFYYWINMSAITVSMVFVLLNGWLAKGSFERDQNTFGWFWVFLSAWNFAEVLNVIF